MPGRAASSSAGFAELPLRGERLWLALVLVLGAGLRFRGLGEGLWYDEIATLVRYARRPFLEIVTRFDTQNQHMLYSIIAHASVRAFGENAWALRLPAAAFGVASLRAVWWLGVQIAPRREALIAAGLLAVSSHHVWFSQDARGYSMLMFFSLVATGLFRRLLEREQSGRGEVLAYAAVMALACWTQVAGGFVLIAHGIVWMWAMASDRRIPPRRPWTPLWAMLLAGVVTGLLYLPVLGGMIHTLAGPKATGGAAEWKSPVWFALEAARGLARGIPGGWFALVAGVAVGSAGVWSYGRRSITVLLLLIVPVLVTAIVMLATAHNLWPRLFFFAAGFAALIAVRGAFLACEMLFRSRGPVVATAGAAVVGAASLFTVPRVWTPKQDYAGALEFVRAARAPGEAVVTVDMTRLPYRDFYHTDWTAADSLPDLLAAERSAPRTWVLYAFPERLAAVDSAMWAHVQHYTEVRRFPGTVQGGTIVVTRTP